MDRTIILWLNEFAGKAPLFDRTVCWMNSSDLARGVVVMCVYWWMLFRRRRSSAPFNDLESHHQLAFVLLLSVPAMVLARALAALLPFRTRPMLDASLHLLRPCPLLVASTFENWSAMPSDHAVLFALLAAGLWFQSRVVGSLVAGYVMLAIWFPRVYLGIHWPSDIVAGALFGLALAGLTRLPGIRRPAQTVLKRWCVRFPGLYYACLFLVSFEVASLFAEPRHLLTVLHRFAR